MKRTGIILAAMAWLLMSPVYAGTSGFINVAQLKELLNKDQPCCVIDARDAGSRKKQPIPVAIVYRDNIKSKAGGYALIVGKDDKQALKLAQKISAKSDGDVFAVAGGYATWQQAQSVGDMSSGKVDGMPRSFIIPSNTCEQGKPLQVYK
ncbi:MAG: hypothetical protein ABI479_06280 [Gallionella sp.]